MLSQGRGCLGGGEGPESKAERSGENPSVSAPSRDRGPELQKRLEGGGRPAAPWGPPGRALFFNARLLSLQTSEEEEASSQDQEGDPTPGPPCHMSGEELGFSFSKFISV